MIRFPHAKINIGLQITNKRPDGYHELESIFYPVELTDILEFVEAKADNLSVYGLKTATDFNDNLATKALLTSRKKWNIPPLDIALYKKIPSGAGLGGGSSDASFMLSMLNHTYGQDTPAMNLEIEALKLGSDCPFFLKETPCLATGRGELLHELPAFLDGWYWMIIHPGFSVSTADAYSRIKPEANRSSLSELTTKQPAEWKEQVTNDFELAAFEQYPVLPEVKNALYNAGASYASMTGSGSAMYGIFESVPPETLNLNHIDDFSTFRGQFGKGPVN